MENDDAPVGRILSRREMIALLGAGGSALFLGRVALGASGAGSTPTATAKTPARSCIARPELTEGPFFVDEGLNRSDIRLDPLSGKMATGALLEIQFNVSRISDACVALPGALVDVWQCDALGRYSDVAENGTAGHKFLRGQQVTDARGIARFITVVPGWYQGRAVHTHFKIRAQEGGATHEFTSQFFFDDALIDRIHQTAPYNRNGQREQTNQRDGIFQEGGRELLLDLKPKGQGYTTTFDIGLDLSQPPRQGGGRGPGRGGPGGRGPGRGGPGGPGDGPPPPFFDW